MNTHLKAALSVVLAAWMTSAFAQEDGDVLSLSLEDLMGMEITSVSKKSERLQDVASSIYVFTSEDLMKTGATSLHEVLRNVPGYWGTQDEYSSVELSVRNSRTANNINGTVLFLLDGTPMQDLMSSSFNFRNFDLPLDEIDRIEVIRGSGGTIYGANSATGVINIFTKNPEKYDGINVRAEGATPGYLSVSARAGGKVGENLSISGYGKVRNFTGFDSFAGKNDNGESLGINSRFTEDYETTSMISTGLKAVYNFNENAKFSVNTHFNTLQTVDYTSTYEDDALDIFTATIVGDQLFQNDINDRRFVGNIRFDQNFGENHSLFARVSTNSENAFNRLGGGFYTNNTFYDFEIQDNIGLGSFNDLSFGFNYRIVQFDIYDINSNTVINFTDPQAQESLTGAFVQDRVRLLDDKLNITLGMKTENFSLVNDKYYWSPMAKVSFIPTSNLTLWGGFTQSYTTPGFSNTNIELFLFQTAPRETWLAAAQFGVYDAFYDTYLEIAEGQTSTPEEAAALADQLTTDFLSSSLATDLINSTADGLERSNPNYAVRNGSNTVPTKYQAFEFGARTSVSNILTVETNLFYNIISDGIATQSFDEVSEYLESPLQPGRLALYYQYGNYVQGISQGAESMIRWIPSSRLNFEFSHTWVETSWEYQENPDFDINNRHLLSEEELDRTPGTPYTPKHVFRFRGIADLGNNLNVSATFIQSGKFATESRYRFDEERYENIIGSRLEATPSTLIAKNTTRTILSLRVEKGLMDNKLSVYAFGNDLLNDGIFERTNQVFNTTVSQIGRMYGIGLNYQLGN